MADERRAGKLHELLAAEGTNKAQADKCRSDLINTFDKKRHLFGEKVVTFQSATEGVLPVTEEQLTMQSTIPSELKWLADIWSKAVDAAYQIAESNMSARADVTLDDGRVLYKMAPATALLELEKRASEIHGLVSAIPTLDPAKGFKPAADKGASVYAAREVKKTRTKKVEDYIVVVPATTEHPAQVAKVTKDIDIGVISELEWSGLITPAQKADMLNRAEELRRAFKMARSRANEAAAANDKIASKMFDFVFGQ